MLSLNTKSESKRLIKFIREKTKLLHKFGVILGLSGGLDSSVVAVLAKKAFPNNSLALILPERHSDKKKIKVAKSLCEDIGLNYEVIDISEILDEFGVYNMIKVNSEKIKEKLIEAREKTKKKFIQGIKPQDRPEEIKKLSIFYMPKLRTRMIMIYKYAYLNNLAVLGTTDKTEYLIGQYDPLGDGACDIDVITHLYKTQVKKLGKFLGVPDKILNFTPSPDLYPGITSEDMWGMSSYKLDVALWGIQHKYSIKKLNSYGISNEEIKELKEAIKNAELRRKLPYMIK